MTERVLQVRREPPRFRRAAVVATTALSARMIRVALSGPELEGLVVDSPAASVRLLLPSPDAAELVIPTWRGNEFLLDDGRRPIIRTFTPPLRDGVGPDIELDIVIHDGGISSRWAQQAAVGAEVALSGPGRGYEIDAGAAGFYLAGDESAIPAMRQLVEVLPAEMPVEVHVEVAGPGARLPFPEHPNATIEWHDLPSDSPPGATLLEATRAADVPKGVRVWVAGEAAGVQRIRNHLFKERDVPRSQATVRGYWKIGRGGD